MVSDVQTGPVLPRDKSDTSDTIVALSSGSGTAGVAVVRVSGPGAAHAVKAITRQDHPPARQADLRTFTDPVTGRTLDKGLILYFAAPASFTGEDVVEFQGHGGQQTVASLLTCLTSLPGIRLAEPGEFSRRAFEHGKLDLTEVEGLNDLIHAQTAAQQDLALRQMDGALRGLYEDWRTRLMGHLAHLEADIEFPDEDLPGGIAGALSDPLTELAGDLDHHLADGRIGEITKDGYRIALVGSPNAGKSTLMNRLANRDVAIVTDTPGTTRDVIESAFDLGGYKVRLFDLAGLRETADQVEQEGVRRAKRQAGDSDLCLVLVPAGTQIDDDIKPYLEDGILIWTKTDLAPMFHVEHPYSEYSFSVSAKTGEGVDDLIVFLTNRLQQDLVAREQPVLTRARHREKLTDALTHINQALTMLPVDEILAAEDLRLATRALGAITGRVGVEDRLDVIFRDFCIGK